MMRRTITLIALLIVSLIALSLFTVPLRRANTSEFEWMIAFSLSLFSGVILIVVVAALVVITVRALVGRNGSSVSPDLPPPPVRDTSALSARVRIPEASARPNRRASLPRSAFARRWEEQRTPGKRDTRNTIEMPEAAQTPSGMDAQRTPRRKLWGFTDISEDRRQK